MKLKFKTLSLSSLIAFLILGLFTNIWWRIQAIRLAYTVERLQAQLAEKKENLQHIETELSELGSAVNLGKAASERFNLIRQDPEKVNFVDLS